MSKSPNSTKYRALQWLTSLAIVVSIVIGTSLLWLFISFGEVYPSSTYQEADYNTVKQQLEISPQTYTEADYEYVKKMLGGNR